MVAAPAIGLPVAVESNTAFDMLIRISSKSATAMLVLCGAIRAARYASPTSFCRAATAKAPFTEASAMLRLLKFLVVWNATTFGTAGPSRASDSAASWVCSSVRTSGVTTPARAAAASFRVTAARLAPSAPVIRGRAAESWASSGSRRAARAIRSIVVLSSAAREEAADLGAAWCSRALSCSLDWLYSSGMPSMCPYSWA